MSCFETTAWNWSRLFVKGHYWWYVMVLWLWPRNKATVEPFEGVIITASKKCQIKHQNNGDLFLWCQGLSSFRVCSPRSGRHSNLSSGSFKKIAQKDSSKMTNDPCGGRQVVSSSTTTMRLQTHSNLCYTDLTKNGIVLLPTHFIRPTWLHAIFSYFDAWKGVSKDPDLIW